MKKGLKFIFGVLFLALMLVACDKPKPPENAAPVIHGAEDKTIEVGETFVPLQGITATDEEDGDLTHKIQFTGNVNINVPNVYTVTYEVTDSGGKKATVEIKVTVVFVDRDAPILAGVVDVEIVVGQVFNPMAGVSSVDDTDGVITADIVVDGEVNIWVPGNYTLTYTSVDSSDNETEKSRVVTVGFGYNRFQEESALLLANWDFDDVAFVLDGEIGKASTTKAGSMSQVISGGLINPQIGAFTLVKLVVEAKAANEAAVAVSLENAISDGAPLQIGTDYQVFTKYFRIDSPLDEALFKIEFPDLENEYDVKKIELFLGEHADLIAPELTVPAQDVHIPAGDLDLLISSVKKGVMAEDNIDGNLTSSIEVELGDLDIDVPGVYDVVLKVKDSSDNETTKTRTVYLYQVFNTNYILDPTFDNPLNEDQWGLSGGGNVTLYVEDGLLVVDVIEPGGWDSASSPYVRGLTTDQLLPYNWYMFKVDVKAEKQRKMSFRAGLEFDTDPWIDDFSHTVENEFLNLQHTIKTTWTTVYYIFYVNKEKADTNVVKFEIKVGTFDWSDAEKNNKIYFDNAQFYLLSLEDSAPEVKAVKGLQTTFAVGDAKPDWKEYVTIFDREDGAIEVLDAMVDDSDVNMAAAGDYVVVYTVVDSGDNEVEFVLNIKVLAEADVLAPVLTVDDQLPTEFDQFDEVEVDLKAYVSAVDNIDGEIAITDDMIDDGGFSVDKAGVFVVVYTVKDSSLNEATVEVTLTVNDKEGPKFSGLSDTTLTVGEMFNPFAGVSVSDNVDGEITLTLEDITGLEAFLDINGVVILAGEFEVVYKAVDIAGNETEVTILVTVVDIDFNESAAIDLLALELDVDVGDEPGQATSEYLPDGSIEITYNGPSGAWWASATKLKYTGLQLEAGVTHKLVLEVKVETEREILVYFQGKTEPILGFEGKKKVALTTDFVVLEYIFTPEDDNPFALELQMGWDGDVANSGNANVITFKQIKIVPELTIEFDYEKAIDFIAMEAAVDNDGDPKSNAVYNEDGTVDVNYMGAAWWASHAKLKYANLELDSDLTYKFVVEVKAETARDILIYFVNKDGDRITSDFNKVKEKMLMSITEDYVVYELIFKPEVEGPYDLELHFGWEDVLNNAADPNVITFKQILIVPEYKIEFDEENAIDFIAMEVPVDNDGDPKSNAVYNEDGTVDVNYMGAAWWASHAKLKYANLDLNSNIAYKFIVEVKAETARDILIYFVNKDGDRITPDFNQVKEKMLMPITEDFVVYELIIVPEVEGPYDLEFHFGWEDVLTNAADPNVITFKQIKLVPEKVHIDYVTDAAIAYDLSDIEGTGQREDDTAFWEGVFADDLLDSITAVDKLYKGNGSGGTYPETPGLVKTGTTNDKGILKFKFNEDVLIKTVVFYIEGWDDNDKLLVNGAEYDLNATKTYGKRVVVELAKPTNVIDIQTDTRSFLFALEFYGPDAEVRVPVDLTISFDYGYDEFVEEIPVEKNRRVYEPRNIVREGYKFVGWFADLADDEVFDFGVVMTEDKTFYAKWEEDPYTKLDAFFGEGKAGLAAIGWEENGLGSDYGGDPKLKFDHTGDYIKSPTFALTGKADVSIWYKNNSISGTSKVTIYDQDDNIVFEFDNFVASGQLGYIEFVIEANVTQLKIHYTKDKGNLAVGSVTVILQH